MVEGKKVPEVVEVTYLQEGSSHPKYGLSALGNYGIDERRKRLAKSQESRKGTRGKLESRVRTEGGKVNWEKPPKQVIVLPYTRAQHEKLIEMEKRVADKFKTLIEKYGLGGLDELKFQGTIDECLTGRAHFRIMYEPEGRLAVERLPEGASARVYSFTEANSALVNLEKYADAVEKIQVHKLRHGEKGGVEAKVEGAIAVIATVLGALGMGTVTGYATASTPVYTHAHFWSVLLFVVGLFAGFMYFRKRE